MKRGGGQAEKVLRMLKVGGGHNKFWGSFYAARSFSPTERGAHKQFPKEKKVWEKFYPVLRGGGAQRLLGGGYKK